MASLLSLPDRARQLLAVSAYAPAENKYGLDLDSPQVRALRASMGGQIQPIPRTQVRWYLKDLENAALAADTGNIGQAARLMAAATEDGILSGALSTRTGGLVRLPKQFRGLSDAVQSLSFGYGATRSVFAEMCPDEELAKLAADGTMLGVGVAELVPVEGRTHPVLVRLDPEFLMYRWSENQWYYRSIAGLIPVTPGDGRWVLHTPGGRISPWRGGLWRCLGRAYIRKSHAQWAKDNWEAKLANPARVAVAPSGAGEAQADSWFRQVMAWGINTVFGMRPGYDVKLLESNGRGYESFAKTIAEQNEEMIIAIAGQTVTTDGGSGFANADIHKSVRADLIKSTADSLAHTVNTQILPAWLIDTYGEDALAEGVTIQWDVTPPKDRNAEASALVTVATAVRALTEAFAMHGIGVDVRELAERFGVPITDLDPMVQIALESQREAPDLLQ